MSIPVALQSFKSAGIYRLVYDKSTILNEDTQIMRLVIGYSAQGPFNVPVLVRSISEFKALYGEVSKSLEKRGVYFHRLALQALLEGPIICLNLKRFSGETLQAATVDTSFNPDMTPIDTVELNVEDIYDTTRFWELSAFKLADINDVSGRALDGYISISSTNTKNTSGTFFLRKASGSKVAAYNVTVNDWYKDSNEEVPEYLQDKLNNKISDFFAEIYIFKGQFTPDQVLASETLKHYFMSVKEDGEDVLKLRPFVRNAYDEPIDTLEALYNEPTAGGVSHYVGALIPYFKDKTDVYQALDIQMNNDVDTNNMMMNFNVDLLEDGLVNIDLSGRTRIPVEAKGGIGLDLMFGGDATSTLLGNEQAPIVSDVINFAVNYTPVVNDVNKKRITGNFYVSDIKESTENPDSYELTFKDIKFDSTTLVDDKGNLIDANNNAEGTPIFEYDSKEVYTFTLTVAEAYMDGALTKFGITDELVETEWDDEGRATAWTHKYYGGAYRADADLEAMSIPEVLITSISNYGDVIANKGNINYVPRINFAQSPISIASNSTQKNKKADGKTDLPIVFGSSVSFVPKGSFEVSEYDGSVALISTNDSALVGFFAPGDCLIAADGSTDADSNGEIDAKDGYYDNVYVQEVGSAADADGIVTYYVKLTGEPMVYSSNDQKLIKVKVTENSDASWIGKTLYYNEEANADGLHQIYSSNGIALNVWIEEPEQDASDPNAYSFKSYGDAAGENELGNGKVKIVSRIPGSDSQFLIRIDAPLNQEIGSMTPIYLEGYTYANPKPASTSMYDKQKWQDFILSTLTDYKGIRTGLLNKADLDYRYVIDTFETYVTAGAKNILSFLCKEKQSAFAILNFPSVRTFVKCPYTSFTDSKGIFNVEYVVKGYNPKKSHTVGFSLPSDSEGASFCAFYTPLKFTDGYIDSLIPSAALVSNLFIEKYRSRQPYYIVAGPNYGAISASGMSGPDYNFSRDELNVIEPYGVNCMVYRPGFGTFINANQTAKQTPKSALSSVNVRELVIYLQDEIEKLLQSYQWEFNNQTVRNKIKDKADVICARIQHNGGIQDFVNIMDESNNTPEIIDNEMAVLSTHIEPGRGMGKMVHKLTLYRTGQMRAAISEA